MAHRDRTGDSGSPACCRLDRLCLRRELEDMPMGRVDAQAGQEETCCQSACHGWGCCRELVALLEDQNQLLCDILGAVNSLTAAQLAAGRGKE